MEPIDLVSIDVEGWNEEIEFSNGFTELHTRSYKDILEGKGVLLKENLKVIKLVHDIRNANLTIRE